MDDLDTPHKVPPGRDLATAGTDRYAKYQLVGEMTGQYPSVGYVTNENGDTETVELDLKDQETRDQESYNLVVLTWAFQLQLYERRGFHFFLTEKGDQTTFLRQRMAPMDARALIRETMRLAGLKVLQESEKEWVDTYALQQVTEQPANL